MRAMVVAVLLAMASGPAWAAGLGFGSGGPLRGVLLVELAELNSHLVASGFPALSGGLTLAGGSGGGGVTGVLAFGGMGFGGSVEAGEGDRRAKLEIGYGAFVVEYPLALGSRAVVSFGAGIGGGAADLELRFRKASGFDDALASPTMTRLKADFFGLLPYLRLRVAPVEWLLLDGWAGYLVAFPGPWQDGEEELDFTPSLSGAFFALELVFGGMEEEAEGGSSGD